MSVSIIETLDRLSDSELLNCRLCDFNVSLGSSHIFQKIQFLFEELHNAELIFKPKIYMGDEWFSPDGVPAIAIPFYLIHPKLISLEKNMIGFAEGANEEHFRKLLRHECGHAIIHGFNLTKHKHWRNTFGDPKRPFNDHYRFKAYSRNFVHHIEGWYAQSHPEEDFCETFSVWLNPESHWREKYKDWPVIRKLNYIHTLMDSLKNKDFSIKNGTLSYHVRTLKRTLRTHYKMRRKELAEGTLDYFDDELKALFSEQESPQKADALIKKYQSQIESLVSEWSGEKKYVVSQFLKKLRDRVKDLKLYSKADVYENHENLIAYVSCRIMHYRLTNQFRMRGR